MFQKVLEYAGDYRKTTYRAIAARENSRGWGRMDVHKCLQRIDREES
ncbi:hypothetical protein [Lacrimispora brassicae]